MNEYQKTLAAAQAYTAAHIHEACRELREWGRTTVLLDGRVRDLESMVRLLNPTAALMLARTLFEQEAVRLVASQNTEMK